MNSPHIPIVSIVIVNYNTGNYLKDCIRSFGENINKHETIIIDNNSSDDSLSKIKDLNSHITIIKDNENNGFAKANNKAARVTHGDFLLFLNPDTEITSGSIDLLCKRLKSDNAIGIVGPQLLNTDGTKQESWGSLPQGIDIPYQKMRYFPTVGYIKGAALMIRRELFDTLRGFDEEFFMYSEERDLAVRCWQSGYSVEAVSEATIYHHAEKSSPSYSIPGHIQLHTSQLLFIKKHLRFPFNIFQHMRLACKTFLFYLHALAGCPGYRLASDDKIKRKKLFHELSRFHLKHII